MCYVEKLVGTDDRGNHRFQRMGRVHGNGKVEKLTRHDPYQGEPVFREVGRSRADGTIEVVRYDPTYGEPVYFRIGRSDSNGNVEQIRDDPTGEYQAYTKIGEVTSDGRVLKQGRLVGRIERGVDRESEGAAALLLLMRE